jgi:hypothetical protein
LLLVSAVCIQETLPKTTLTKKSTNETYISRNRAPSDGEAQESIMNGEPHG